MTAFEYLKSFPFLPPSTEGKRSGTPSNSEIKRWLIKQSVIINGEKVSPHTEVSFPITELVFFPGGKRKCTMVS